MADSNLAARRAAAIARGVGVATQIYAERAENAEIWDASGRRYIDFAAGIAVVNTGHRHPRMLAAVKEQIEKFTHTCHQVVPYENYVSLAERLNAAPPATSPRRPSSSPRGPRRWRTRSRSRAAPRGAPASSPSAGPSMAAPSSAWR